MVWGIHTQESMTLRNRIAITFAPVELHPCWPSYLWRRYCTLLTQGIHLQRIFNRLEERFELLPGRFGKDELNQQNVEGSAERHLRTFATRTGIFAHWGRDSAGSFTRISGCQHAGSIGEIRRGKTYGITPTNFPLPGIRYEDNPGHICSIVAQDSYKQRKLTNLLRILMLFILGCPAVFLLGRWYAWHLLPIGTR